MNYAKIAYEAYAKQTHWKSIITGDKLPEFENLRPEIQAAWETAAKAVYDAALEPCV